MNWKDVAETYIEETPHMGDALRSVVGALHWAGMDSIPRSLDPEVAAASKHESTEFVVHAIAHALRDHVLTPQEVSELRTLQRICRIEEGELVEHQRSSITDLVCREAELIFEDLGVSPEEEAKKARLQEVLGVGYDDFIGLLRPETEQLHQALLDRFRSGADEPWQESDWTKLRDRLGALSLSRFAQWLPESGETTAGYIYLMVNPSMPGMVKVGRTGQPPSRRAAALTGATGVPTPFEVVFEVLVPDQRVAEAYVHRVLEERGRRVSSNREFFAVQPEEAIQVMVEVHDRLYLGASLGDPGGSNVS